MVSTFISPVIGRASELGVGLYEDSEPVELFAHSSTEEIDVVIRAVYRQVLGNAYVMESERLPIPESQLRQGDISVREFVRQVALSELYRSRFFDNNPRYRSIELNFKHLLGRAPESYEEMNNHSQILDEGGYEAEINSYLDSDEYTQYFGDNIVPYYRGYKTQTGKKMVGFTHLFKLLRGASSSDKNLTMGNYARLTRSLINNSPSQVVAPSRGSSCGGGISDVSRLIADAVKTKPQSTTYSVPTVQTQSEPTNLEQKYQTQAKQINQLQQKLADLSPFATIGTTELNRWQSKSSPVSSQSEASISISSTTNQSTYDSSNRDLQIQVKQQAETIANLEEQVADAQRLASIGEARLNKWRSRAFF